MTLQGVLAQLQAAYIAKLQGDAGVKAIFGANCKVYEDVPDGIPFPYISLGEDQEIPKLAECINGSEIYVTLHAWSRKGGYGEVKQGAAAIEACLHEAEFDLDDFHVVLFERHGVRTMKDPDGLTTHAVVTFRTIANPR